MFRKALCYVVLTAMVLHCGSRIGVLSFLYEKRNNIAFSLGLISEVPIAVCSSQYTTPADLRLIVENASAKIPAIAVAQEINLFFVHEFSLAEPFSKILLVANSAAPLTNYYHLQVDSIFHPPSA